MIDNLKLMNKNLKLLYCLVLLHLAVKKGCFNLLIDHVSYNLPGLILIFSALSTELDFILLMRDTSYVFISNDFGNVFDSAAY